MPGPGVGLEGGVALGRSLLQSEISVGKKGSTTEGIEARSHKVIFFPKPHIQPQIEMLDPSRTPQSPFPRSAEGDGAGGRGNILPAPHRGLPLPPSPPMRTRTPHPPASPPSGHRGLRRRVFRWFLRL